MSPVEPIAIVGLAGCFPGSPDLDAFQAAVREGRSLLAPIPSHRGGDVARSLLAERHGVPDHLVSTVAGLVDVPEIGDLHERLAASGWDPSRVESLDPLVRLILRVGVDAWDDAQLQTDPSRSGIILANIALPTDGARAWSAATLGAAASERLGRPTQGTNPDPLDRYVTALPVGILASCLGFGGSAYSLDAACASSLYAIALACEELRAGRLDAVIAGGASRPDCLYTSVGFSQLRALSKAGRCIPFSREADGLVVGEGAGAFVLVRLADALRDRLSIRAVVRGEGLSNDREGSLLAPATEGQVRAMRAAYDAAGFEPGTVDLIECHGTGTPRGDATELRSLATLRQGAERQAVIGSVKSNVGHLLTGAGAAGLMKVVLAIEEGVLPPSVGLDQNSAVPAAQEGGLRVLDEAESWPAPLGHPRRAAVSAFGFGGINAHVLVEQWTGETALAQAPSVVEPIPLAITGVGARVGGHADAKSLAHALLTGEPDRRPRPPGRWGDLADDAWLAARAPALAGSFPGAWIDGVDLPIGRFKLPPNEVPQVLPQHTVALLAAGEASEDAGWSEGGPRAGCVVGAGLDLETGAFALRWSADPESRAMLGPALDATRTQGALGGMIASRIARELDLGGPSFLVSNEDGSGARALEVAARLLRTRRLDRVLVVGVDLAGDLRAVLADHERRPFATDGLSRVLDPQPTGPVPGEGAVALVLERLDDARTAGRGVHAVISGLGSAHGDPARAAELAWSEAGVERGEAGVLELSARGGTADEMASLGQVFQDSGVAVGAASGVVGDVGAASGLVSLLRATLALREAILPAQPDFEANPQLGEWGLHVPVRPLPWLRDRAAGPRRAGVSTVGVDGSALHVALEEAPQELARPTHALPRAAGLFLLEGDDSQELDRAADELEGLLRQTPDDESVDALARRWHHSGAGRQGKPNGHVPGRRVFVAASVRELRSRLREARGAGPLRAAPQLAGRLAWVFPGSGNHYVGMGQDLLLGFPEVARTLDEETETLASQLVPSRFGPHRADWTAGWREEALTDVESVPHEVIFGQVAHGVTVARTLEHLGIRPDAILGYSLGESAGLFSSRAWTDRDVMFQRVLASPLFRTQLSGPNDIAAEAWGGARDWWCAVLDVDAEVVRTSLVDRDDTASLLIVNTPGECVVGGRRRDVEQLAERVGAHPRPLFGVPTVHCSLVEPVATAYRDLHVLPTAPREGVSVYSGSWGRAYELDSDAAADSILSNALHGLDWPKTVTAAWEDGVRVFVECGPQGSCTRMIGEILGERPHIAVTACRKGRDGVHNLLDAVAALLEAGVSVDLDALYPAEQSSDTPRGPTMTVQPGANLRVGGMAMTSAVSAEPVLSEALVEPQPTPAASRTPAPRAVPHSVPRPVAASTVAAPKALEGASSRVVAELASLASTPLTAAHDTAVAHRSWLELTRVQEQQALQALAHQQALIEAMLSGGGVGLQSVAPSAPPSVSPEPRRAGSSTAHPAAHFRSDQPLFDRDACLDFAVGSVQSTYGPEWVFVDEHPTRVRLPDEPLMLVDRILAVEGEQGSMGSGRVVTEHDVFDGAWYLDGGRVPVCISVESGQADLFLSGWLGIDRETRGERVYRLLDAEVAFHRDLPRAGETIRYDIHIDRFIRQGSTWLFFFHFEGWIGDEHLISMRDGCAGFFSTQQLDQGKGLVERRGQLPQARRTGHAGPAAAYRPLVPGDALRDREQYAPLAHAGPRTLDRQAIESLRSGDLAGAFGPAFAGRRVVPALRLPGGRMELIHRITELDLAGGRYGLGVVESEWDVDPLGWYLVCHFSDDRVMPGTLMYEGCLHTLRVLLLRLGWGLAPEGVDVHHAPIPGIPSRLCCRGQVTETTRTLTYRIDIKEIGYDPEPYVLADAFMVADGRDIVEFENVSYRVVGTEQAWLEEAWREASPQPAPVALGPADLSPFGPPRPGKPALYDASRILAFAVGNPSEAFGAPYRVFDQERRIARLPGPPFCFLDRVTEAQPAPFVLQPGGWIEAEYDVPPDAWYFAANGQRSMPFAVILETALQPCGWLAAYLGSALRSDQDLHFRNLDGTATLYGEIGPDIGTLTVRAEMTACSEAAGMILQEFQFQLWGGGRLLYDGTTGFGFFPAASLANQVGVRGAGDRAWEPSGGQAGRSWAIPPAAPGTPDEASRLGPPPSDSGVNLPGGALCMIDRVESYLPQGGAAGLGWIRGTKDVDPEDWFFAAHFHQDPVIPGSLGLEGLLQLLRVVAMDRWGEDVIRTHRLQPIAVGVEHTWMYRGQVVPTNRTETVEASITAVSDGPEYSLTADGFLRVDGKIIYEMKGFQLRLVPGDHPVAAS